MINEDIFAFLDLPAYSSVATDRTINPLIIDEVDSMLKDKHEYPHRYPTEKRDERGIRFYYRKTNETEAKSSFGSIMHMYIEQVIYKSKGLNEHLLPFCQRMPPK